MKITVRIRKASNKNVTYDISQLITSLSWSGTDTQASRKLEFSVAQSQLDADFPKVPVETGDIVYFSFDGGLRFVGRITGFSQSAGGTEISYSASDFLNLLLKSDVSYVFRNTTAEAIAEKVLSDFGIEAGKLARTKVTIQKWIVDSENAYNVLIGAYYKAFRKTRKKYFPVMDGTKVSVIEKGEDCGAVLQLSSNVKSTTLEENADEIVNKVLIFDEDGKKIGSMQNSDSIRLFGIHQQILKKEKGTNARKEAEALFKEPTREASVEATGDIRCTAGKSIVLKDTQTGLLGRFWIESDSHSFSGSEHTMSLKLAFSNTMEGTEEDGKSRYPIATGEHEAFYSTGGDKFHSARKCGTGLVSPIRTTVNEAIKTGRGKCSRCWK